MYVTQSRLRPRFMDSIDALERNVHAGSYPVVHPQTANGGCSALRLFDSLRCLNFTCIVAVFHASGSGSGESLDVRPVIGLRSAVVLLKSISLISNNRSKRVIVTCEACGTVAGFSFYSRVAECTLNLSPILQWKVVSAAF